ncbi:glycogen synthase GlgA [Glaciimonas immobilis]|uniref:Glycogen synthase n=1 Tax=Glaciimonas immobilis TaxID=728004 RepID=A0A840RSH2_9BURK|nr:glycogen synthase GlgA [Glaciimonas immobilis]MBB5199551.1 starch synthase [Glaciimonas immobilis]
MPRVLFVTSEAVPLAKTGGLADVITALAATLRTQGIDVTILMPGYPSALDGAKNLTVIGSFDDFPGGSGRLRAGVIPDINVPVILLDTERFRACTGNLYVDQDGREFADNAVNFASLAYAAIKICAGRTTAEKPHVVHAHDWHAGLIPALLRTHNISDIGTILTVHNLAFQGNFPLASAAALGLPQEMLNADGAEFWGQVSFLKAGVRYADKITTVSHAYAREILTPRFGHGFEGLLNQRKEAISAIPNGIDIDMWNSATDPLIARRFSSNDMKGKIVCKRELKRLFNLTPINEFAPVLALGSRITHQKMADVALAALPTILQNQPYLQLAVLGCGEPVYHAGFRQLMERFPGRVGLHLGYDEKHAHALHAGADMLLHGSRFEPFGLTPLYAMRYGTIPIASRVGGLSDTITDAGTVDNIAANANGVLFDGEEPQDMIDAVDRAFQIYSHTAAWHKLQMNAMSVECGWDTSAQQYIALYGQVAAADTKHLFLDEIAPRREREPLQQFSRGQAKRQVIGTRKSG